MEKRDERRERERKKEWQREERVGGGPEAPGGDTEPSNWPGETQERGMRPHEAEPVLPSDPEEL